MPSFASTLTLAALLVPALASPLVNLDPRGKGCYGSSDEWCSKDPKANVAILVSDKKINWGNVDPARMTKALLETCHNNICDTDDVNMKTLYIKKGDIHARPSTGTFKVKVDQQPNPKYTPEIIRTIQETLQKLKESKKMKYTQAADCFNADGGTTGGCSSPEEQEDWQHIVPESISISVREKEEKPLYERGIVSSMTLHFESEENDTLKGACGALVGLGSAFAGVLHPMLGAAGAVGAFACS